MADKPVEPTENEDSLGGNIVLWDDNPSAIDLLAFDSIVAPIISAIKMQNLDPLTIGIHGPWGGGKSTILGLLEKELKDTRYIVVKTTPWEYEDQADVKGTLIAQVLNELEVKLKEQEGIKDKVNALIRRISWSRVTLAIAKGALTMQWDIEKLIDAFTPKQEDGAETMSGFREAFSQFINTLQDVDRVVVLVDDLDRCLPYAVMSTLEAIKLFLSVNKMVFVIAADQEMVRDSIAASLGSSSRSERFAKRYLDKIIQLPVSLPRLAPYEAEAYIGLLLIKSDCTEAELKSLISHCKERRQLHRTPLLDNMEGLPYQPSEDLLRLASQLAQGLKADRVTNPREIKRFLNAFSVRKQIAASRGIKLAPAVIAKLLLLEDRYRPDFEILVGTPEVDRSTLLSDWEKWARGGNEKQPDRISDISRLWAASDPSISGKELGPYINLAASLSSASIAGAMGEELMRLMSDVIGESQVVRRKAVRELVKRPSEDQRTVIAGIFEHIRLVDDITYVVSGLVDIAKAIPILANEIAAGISDHCYSKLQPASAVDLGGSDIPELVALCERIRDDEAAPGKLREAARQTTEVEAT